MVYNQIIFVPNQKRELALLDKKKNRHGSMPNPNNLIAVEDIKRVQDVISRENKQLVYTHYNLIVTVKPDTDIQKCTNHLENAFAGWASIFRSEPTTSWNCLSTLSPATAMG